MSSFLNGNNGGVGGSNLNIVNNNNNNNNNNYHQNDNNNDNERSINEIRHTSSSSSFEQQQVQQQQFVSLHQQQQQQHEYHHNNNRIHQQQPYDNPTSFSFSSTDSFSQLGGIVKTTTTTPTNAIVTNTSTATPFFADAMLDLEEAHDIADTPEPSHTRKCYDPNDETIQSILSNVTTQFIVGSSTSNSNRGGGSNNSNNNSTMLSSNDIINATNFHTNNNNHINNTGGDALLVPSLLGSSRSSIHDDENDKDQEQQQEQEEQSASTIVESYSRITASHIMGGKDFGQVQQGQQRFSNTTSTTSATILPPCRPPRWPRDMSWTITFWIFVPISLLYPIFVVEKHHEKQYHLDPLTYYPLSSTTLHALVWTMIATFGLCRILYRSSGGIDGDDTRYVATQFLFLKIAPLSIIIYLLISIMLFFHCPTTRYVIFIPFMYTIRDILFFRKWKQQTNQIQTHPTQLYHDNESINENGNQPFPTSTSTTMGSPIPISSGYASRQAFFQALVNMALDILARSLRRESFYRVLGTILLLQLCLVIIWRWALLGAFSSGSYLLVLCTFVGGRWATNTVTRTLTLLASGGVMNWCLQQATLLDNNHNNNSNIENNNNTTENTTTNQFQYYDTDHDENNTNSRVPDAYRTVDASVYRSVLVMDDVLDDDYEDDDDNHNGSNGTNDFGFEVNNNNNNYNNNKQRYMNHQSPRNSSSSSIGTTTNGNVIPRSTVKSILATGLAISFGSIVHCALLGGIAQFIWSQLRKVETMIRISTQNNINIRMMNNRNNPNGNHSSISNNNNNTSGETMSTNLNSTNGFRGMEITDDQSFSSLNGNHYHGYKYNSNTSSVLNHIWYHVHQVLRTFVRNHSDFAMTHVATYYKGYHRAARDVAQFIHEAGIEPILHDDITTHMCSCIGGSITGIILILTGNLLLYQRKKYTDVDDVAVVENMVLAFVLSYTLVFTVLEPIRAAVKSIYVSFAQNPKCISQEYPLIYHRLCRLSETNRS